MQAASAAVLGPPPPSATLPDSANREIMSFTDGGEECSMYYLRARTQEDLRRRMRAHRMIADILNKLRKKC